MEKAQLFIATTNRGKQKEFRQMLRPLPIALLFPQEVGLHVQVAETGSTYAQNATLKAVAWARATGLLTLADDSGLEVEALDGAPGVFSARYAPQPAATDADRRRYLLEQLKGHPRPWKAQFRCVIALAEPGGRVHLAEGTCPGEIIPEERGTHGFGYDPIFYLPSLGYTMAELPLEEKNRLSHRARALQAAWPLLVRLLGLGKGY